MRREPPGDKADACKPQAEPDKIGGQGRQERRWPSYEQHPGRIKPMQTDDGFAHGGGDCPGQYAIIIGLAGVAIANEGSSRIERDEVGVPRNDSVAVDPGCRHESAKANDQGKPEAQAERSEPTGASMGLRRVGLLGRLLIHRSSQVTPGKYESLLGDTQAPTCEGG